MPSQVLTVTQKLAEDIVIAIETHAGDIDSAAAARLRPELRGGERWPSLGLLLLLAGRRVKRCLAAYADAEAALDAERADDVAPRAERDAQAQALFAQLRKVKSAVDSLYGAATVRALQLPAELPRDPAALAQSAGHVVDALKKTKLPAPQVEGVGRVDAGVWVDLLATPLEKLKAARAKVNQEDKELAAALAARDEAAAAASAAMVDALQLARAAARLAGKAALFDGLRATADSRSSQPDGDAPAPPAPPSPPDR